ncbi:MAG: hypothetical protein WD688_07370 [Candidatus Binatia bacterium]
MLAAAIPHRQTLERTVEHIRRAAKSVRVRTNRAQRRQLATTIPRRPELAHLIDEQTGYAKLPFGTIKEVAPAIELAQRLMHDRRAMKKTEDEDLVLLSQPECYEEAPIFFELALSNDVLQIATDYLGEVPIMMRIKLWWTPINSNLKGSQLYHRDGQNWLKRQAKFLFVMNDVDETCGPFTFMPADVSLRVATALGSVHDQERVTDESMFQYANPADAISLVGPPGTGAVVDSSRCFHFGARARGGERLMLLFNFMGSIDAPQRMGGMLRSEGFRQRFGNDPVRELVMPRTSKR